MKIDQNSENKEVKKNLFISFSGGKTSAYMTYKILSDENKKKLYDNIVVIFANTGEEHLKTLEFINNCDIHLKFNTTWIESVFSGKGIGVRPKVVSFETASRNGEPFEAYIKKHGVPNMINRSCTDRLKLDPMHYYVKNILGWKKNYDIAIGIRKDEPRRVKTYKDPNMGDIIYPLVDWYPSDKCDVNSFWESMPFTLEIKEHQGNCKWCWKKSLKKHYLNLKENPHWYDFPERMEELYGDVKLYNDKKCPIFRGYKSTKDLRKEAELFNTYNVSSYTASINEDENSGCTESCELFEMEIQEKDKK